MFQSLTGAFKYFCATALFALLAGCGTTRNSYTPEENVYRRTNLELNVQQIVYHRNDSVSDLYFNLPNDNLVYKRPDTSAWFYAAIRVKYVLLTMSRAKQVVDTGSVWVYDRQPEQVQAHAIKGMVSMKVPYGSAYTLDMVVFDLNKRIRNNKLVTVDKRERASRQNFLMKDVAGNIFYDYYLHPGDEVLVSSERNPQNILKVDYFKGDYLPAKPPYSKTKRPDLQYRPDSSFSIQRGNGAFRITIPESGFYHIVTNEQNEGLTLFSVDKIFPGLKDVNEMIRSTIYIMEPSEYKGCLNAPDKKAAIDDFWKELGGSNERAKELLKKYYGRVMQANRLFTSYQPGWQTERGMIYIIYGSPTNMYKSPVGELWIYGNEADPNTPRFNFLRVQNPFTDNDYVLERNDSNNELFRRTWFNEVTEHWRAGHIYLDN